MAWSRMLFRGQSVWVHTGENGRMVLDSEGRAEMKYRETDQKVYRPSPSNLAPDASPAKETAKTDSHPSKKRAPRANKTTAKAHPRPTATGAVVNVWTDGACSGNPGPMGIGVVVLADGKRREIGEYLGSGTNNIAELVAIERGIEIAAQVAPDPTRPVHVHSDSSYAIGLLSQGWKAKANQELVARVRQVMGKHPQVVLVKVAGHAGVPENERCDELARMAVIKRGTIEP